MHTHTLLFHALVKFFTLNLNNAHKQQKKQLKRNNIPKSQHRKVPTEISAFSTINMWTREEVKGRKTARTLQRNMVLEKRKSHTEENNSGPYPTTHSNSWLMTSRCPVQAISWRQSQIFLLNIGHIQYLVKKSINTFSYFNSYYRRCVH